MSRAVVANPGAIPEMREIASALARAGLLRVYATPFFVGQEPTGFERILPSQLRSLARRRVLPQSVPREAAHSVATALELLFVGLHRSPVPPTFQNGLLLLRDRRFDAAVGRLLRDGDTGVFATNGSALRTIAAARRVGARAVLNCPIAHHRFSEDILAEEARLQPAFASTLQYHRFSRAQRLRLDREVALADDLLALSSFQKNTFVAHGVDPRKIVVVPLGVDSDLFKPDPRDSQSGIFRVLFVGQITQRKGLSYLLDGFKGASIPRSELLFAGKRVHASTWRTTPGFRHIDHRARWDLPDIYRSSDVFVLPSLVEGFGLTALEAMASGLPVIVSEHSFGSDIVTDGLDGYVVPIRDGGAITERLRHLYENPDDRHAMGAAARQRAEQFSWDAYHRRIVGLFTTLLRK